MTPDERVQRIATARKERRSQRARRYRQFFFWPGALAVMALCLLAYQNVQHRDYVVEQRERYEALLDAKNQELAIRRADPTASTCRDYAVHMEGLDLVHCHRTVTRM